VQALSFCPWLLITGRLLMGMGKKLKPVELCSLAHKYSKELMWSMEHNNSKARWGPAVLLMYQHEGYSIL